MLSGLKLLLFTLFLNFCLTADAENWRKRSVYQIFTDRFARPNMPEEVPYQCNDLMKYCGGSWLGIRQNLDYIRGMGFDAIWISPIVKNAADSYHGYFTTDFEQLNPHFGTEEELKAMVQAAHDRDMLVMVDVVANHVAFTADGEGEPEDYTRINPLNKLEYYHKACKIVDWNDKWQLENCRLCGLPDLNQDHPYVKSFLHKWVQKLVATYNFDAIRIDAVAHVRADFWPGFV